MLVAAFIIHADDPFRKQEFALLYAVPYLTLILTGGGKFSIDALIFKKD
jgi:putative oxidoreductase